MTKKRGSEVRGLLLNCLKFIKTLGNFRLFFLYGAFCHFLICSFIVLVLSLSSCGLNEIPHSAS